MKASNLTKLKILVIHPALVF